TDTLTKVEIPFLNFGTVNVTDGGLVFWGGGNSRSATFNAVTPGSIGFSHAAYTWGDKTLIKGDGGTAVSEVSGSITIPHNSTVTVDKAGQDTKAGWLLQTTGATITNRGKLNIEEGARYWFSSGTVTGAGTLTIEKGATADISGPGLGDPVFDGGGNLNNAGL